MAYEGELLRLCPAQMFKFGATYAVIVSGMKTNPYGHMLLNTGGPGGTYFQVSEFHGQPRFMNESQFQRYLKEQDKYIITVVPIQIPYPEKAQLKLETLLSEKWLWGVVVHNCETLVEEIVMAGGGPKLHRGLLSLPTKAANMCSPW
jgi:hypothetical protein